MAPQKERDDARLVAAPIRASADVTFLDARDISRSWKFQHEGKMRKLGSIKPPLGNADILEADNVATIFADGAASVQFSQANSKIDLYSVEPAATEDATKPTRMGTAAGPTERRIVHTRVTMPTVQLLELCSLVGRLMTNEKTVILGALQVQENRVKELIEQLSGKA